MRTSSRRPLLVLTALGVLLLFAILVVLLVDRTAVQMDAGKGSGVAATQARQVAPFTGVDLAGDNNVVVRVGARRSVVVHADDNLLSRVTTWVHSGRLVIGSTPGNLSVRSPMFVTVSLPSLDRLRLLGNGNITVERVDSQRLTVSLSGSGNIQATGSATKLDVEVSGEGTTLLQQLVTRDANAVLTGDGSIMLTATRSLTARISGTGTVVYGGDPSRVSETVTGSGTVAAG